MKQLLLENCPLCGNQVYLKHLEGVVPPNAKSPDMQAYDICENGHAFNYRPFYDFDSHYIYPDLLDARIKFCKAELVELLELQNRIHSL
jgi:hypothetical protein